MAEKELLLDKYDYGHNDEIDEDDDDDPEYYSMYRKLRDVGMSIHDFI